MYNERLLIQSKSTFQIDFSIVFMQRGRSKSKSKRKGKRRSHHRKLRKQADEGEITEFEEVEVVRRPAHSRMRSKLKWKQVVEPPKIVQPESTATTSEGTSTTTSSTASTMSSIMQPPSLSSTVALSTDITSSHESEEEGNKLVAEDEDELKLKKEMEKRKTEKKQRESIRKMSKKQAKRLSEKVESKSKATEMESITAKTRRKLTKMGTKRGKILDDATESQYEEKAGEEINKILNNKFIEEPKKTDLIEDISRYIKESGKRETEKQKVVIGLGSEIPQISTSSISTVSTESSSRRMIEKTAKDKLLEESKSEMPKVEHKFMKLSTPISDTQSSQSAESEAESESNPETQSLQSNETISKQRTMSPSSVSATEKESVSKSLIKSSTPPATSLTESTAKQETKLLTSSLPLLRSLIQTAAQLRIITTARSLTKPEIDLSSTVTPIESVKIIEKQQSTEPSMSLKESITVPRTEFPTATSMSSESPEQPETELSISPALPSTESAKTTEAQQSAVSIKEFVIMSSESPTQPSMSSESLEKPETELSISPALQSTESAKTAEAQQLAVPRKEFITMSSESPTQQSMSSESLENPKTELSILPVSSSTKSTKKLGTEVLVSSFLPIAESVSSSPKIEIASTSLASGMKKLTGDVESKSTTETLSISSSSRNEESKLTAESTKLLSIPATMTNELKLGILMKENKTDREMVIPLYEANLNAEKDLKVAGTAEDIAEPSKNETLSSRKEKKKSEDDESESSDDEKNLKKIRS
uniref:Uncharacterized protein n=1 Tax=Onchocerca volvulus TaxID=6282 RepID=A0A8R1XMP6_ONCVO